MGSNDSIKTKEFSDYSIHLVVDSRERKAVTHIKSKIEQDTLENRYRNNNAKVLHFN